MKVTPLEAFDLVYFLYQNDRLTNDLISQLDYVIKFYRLDHDSGDGSRFFLRRNYTCPFFNEKELGCTIDPKAKPYGCLAFNLQGTKKEGEDCYSKSSLLETIEDQADRKQMNNEVKSLLSLNWEKAYIPIGIRDVALRFMKDNKSQ